MTPSRGFGPRRIPLTFVEIACMDLNYISMNWLLIVRLRTHAFHIVCACVTVVLGFAAHSIISGTDSDAEDCLEDDRYDSLGYSSDFEEFLAECSN